jgi:hypothetical protein
MSGDTAFAAAAAANCLHHRYLHFVCSATGTAEEVTARERQETSDFLEAVMDTRPMRYCHALLVAMVRQQPEQQQAWQQQPVWQQRTAGQQLRQVLAQQTAGGHGACSATGC